MDSKLARSCQGGNTAPLANNTLQSDKWVCTLFTNEPPIWDETKCKYLAYGRETCPKTGREHWQAFVIFKNKILSRKTVQKTLHPTEKFFCEPMRGTLESNETYCSKAGQYTTHGTLPRQGARTDIASLVDAIVGGETTTDEIVLTNPAAFHAYGRTLERAEQIRMSRQYRTEMTQGLWIHGPTDRGKSHYAYKSSGYAMEDIHTQQGHDSWWDHYRQQPCVVLNEFRGQMPYSALLQLVDKWPYTVDRRYKGPIPFTSKLVIVTSPMTPEEVYRGMLSRNDSIAQLLRRFRVVHIDDLRREVDGEV